MQVDFYHLTRQPLERILPRLCERVLAEGGRLLIVSGEAAQRAELDRLLWAYEPESFLPHGLADAPDPAHQPILIAAEPAPLNDARNLAIVDGVWREAALGFARTFHFFDEGAIAAARAAWRALAGQADVQRRYWRQDDQGRWDQVA